MRKITNEELGRPTAGEFAAMEKMPVTVVLDNVRSLQNVGAFFRTGDAFAVEHIALCGITAVPPNRDIHKTALGAELTVPWSYYETTEACIDRLHAGRRAGRGRRDARCLPCRARREVCAGLRQRSDGRGAGGRGPVRRRGRNPAGRDQAFDQRRGFGRRRFVEFFLPDRAGTLTGSGEWPADGRFQINLALRPACAIFAPIYRDYSKSSFSKGRFGRDCRYGIGVFAP